MLTLVFPNSSHKEAYIDIIQEWKNTPEFLSGEASPQTLFLGVNFEEFLSIAEQDLLGNALGAPATLFFLMDGNYIFGAIQIRHNIDHPRLLEFGGHIGYGIRPSERQKGYATKMLFLGLFEARRLGIERVLLGCYDDNIASQKTIESNGGVFERYTEFEGKKSRRYWIDL